MYNQKLLKNYLKIFGSVERSSDICIVDSSTMTGYLWSTTPERREVQEGIKVNLFAKAGQQNRNNERFPLAIIDLLYSYGLPTLFFFCTFSLTGFRCLCPGSGRGCTYGDKKAALQCGTLVDSSKPIPSFSLHCSARLLELSKTLFLSRWPGEDIGVSLKASAVGLNLGNHTQAPET